MARRRNRTDGDDVDAIINSSVASFRQLDRQSQIAIIVLIALLAVVVAIFYFHSYRVTAPGTAATPNLLLGNPSSASTDPLNRDDYLMVKPYFVLSYNSDKGTPNWVSWQLTSEYLGNAPRKQVFDLRHHAAHRVQRGDHARLCRRRLRSRPHVPAQRSRGQSGHELFHVRDDQRHSASAERE